MGGDKLFNREVKQQSRKAACETEIIYRYTRENKLKSASFEGILETSSETCARTQQSKQ